MTGRRFRIAVLVLGALVVVGLSAEAAGSGDSPSLVERAACHACALFGGLLD